ncbi:MAG: hypothetical protein LQ345_006960 [Seirophora villosa]|nr:MAG: hypothetical protein LQ345_006960 [Seirophora villosa]
MAPSVILSNTPDFPSPFSAARSNGLVPRTLLLAPPSLSGQPERLKGILATYDRSATDIQMLDRLSLALINLPETTYDVVLILVDVNDTRTESSRLLTSHVLNTIVRSLKPGGKLDSQDGGLATSDSAERREAVFAGLIVVDGKMVKPDYSATEPIPLRFGKKKEVGRTASSTSQEGMGAVPPHSPKKRKSSPSQGIVPVGVGFVLPDDDLNAHDNGYDEDELIDENDLLSAEDMQSTVAQPVECRPKSGKRRRACKDCTCGLAERIQAEEEVQRSTADQQLAKLKTEELSEVDFTVQGRAGSCGNCALGDAFRCEGCPYIGQPAFKPGEEVKIANEVQL